jgi:prepilin-type N-terminal cleavage/methylation domain-containing protein
MLKDKAFTLIELMFIVTIIGILAALIAPHFMDLPDPPEVAQVKEAIRNFDSFRGGKILKIYKDDKGQPISCILEDDDGDRVKAYVLDKLILETDRWTIKSHDVFKIALDKRIK